MMLECRCFRIQVYRCQAGSYHVYVSPIEYLGKEEFTHWHKVCRRGFMSLTKKWAYERSFPTREEAVLFASGLAGKLGEAVFLDVDRTRAVAPPLEAELRGRGGGGEPKEALP